MLKQTRYVTETRFGGFAIASLGKQPSPLSEIRVLIADERKLFRQGLIALFATELGILVAGDTGDGLDALNQAVQKKPDVLLLNLDMPGMDGIGIGNRLRKSAPKTRIVFLGLSHNEPLMREAFKTGARAYLLQTCDFKELVFAIRKVAGGEYYLTGPAGRELVMEYLTALKGQARKSGGLSPRETELCKLLAEGYSTKEAAARLHISLKTAETHRASVMKKLSAKNVTDIVKYCIRNKIIKV